MEENIKLQSGLADGGQFLPITKPKGNRERLIPLLTQIQRDWLDEVKRLVQHRDHALIPLGVNYKTYCSRFDKVCQRAGINHRHGLRYRYAQQRYQVLTG